MSMPQVRIQLQAFRAKLICTSCAAHRSTVATACPSTSAFRVPTLAPFAIGASSGVISHVVFTCASPDLGTTTIRSCAGSAGTAASSPPLISASAHALPAAATVIGRKLLNA